MGWQDYLSLWPLERPKKILFFFFGRAPQRFPIRLSAAEPAPLGPNRRGPAQHNPGLLIGGRLPVAFPAATHIGDPLAFLSATTRKVAMDDAHHHYADYESSGTAYFASAGIYAEFIPQRLRVALSTGQ